MAGTEDLADQSMDESGLLPTGEQGLTVTSYISCLKLKYVVNI